MRVLITIVLVLIIGLAGCTGQTSPPVELPDVRTLIASDLKLLKLGIEREDPVLASTIVSRKFEMDPNVAVRFAASNWSGEGIGKFRSFFDDVFTEHANIVLNLELFEVAQTGDIATARCRVEFISTYAHRSPPENYISEGWDWFIFELQGAQWELTRWEEAYEPEPHSQGEGTTI